MKRFLNISAFPVQFAAFVLLVVVVNPVGDFPLNDDWQYAYPVKTLLEGEMIFQGIFAPNILLQVGWGYLFCLLGGEFDFFLLRLSTLVAGLLAVWLFYQMCRKGGAEKSAALFTAWSLGLSPLFFSLSFTFMTDVPFLTLVLLSLLSFFYFLEEEKYGWLLLACLSGIGSYFIRQPGIILPVIYGSFLLWKRSFSKTGWSVFLTMTLLAVVTYFGMEKVIKPALGIAGNYVPVGDLYYEALIGRPFDTAFEWLKKGIKTFVYLGIFGIPFLPFLVHRIKEAGILRRRNVFMIFGANLLLLFLLIKAGKVFPFGGNVLYNLGLGPELLADVYTLGLANTPALPEWTMVLFNLAGQFSATVLFMLIIRSYDQLSRPNRRFVLLLLFVNAVYLPLLSITSFFDRYLLLPIASFFFVICLLMEAAALRRFSWKWIPAVCIALFSILATKDYLAWNRARHEAFAYLQSEGVGIEEMDAGYEYNGFYNYHFPREEKEGRSFWWVTDDRYLISFGPVPGYRQLASFPYRRFLFAREDAIRVLVRE